MYRRGKVWCGVLFCFFSLLKAMHGTHLVQLERTLLCIRYLKLLLPVALEVDGIHQDKSGHTVNNSLFQQVLDFFYCEHFNSQKHVKRMPTFMEKHCMGRIHFLQCSQVGHIMMIILMLQLLLLVSSTSSSILVLKEYTKLI